MIRALVAAAVVLLSISNAAHAQDVGCLKDTDYKGSRICVDHACVDPPPVKSCARDLDCPGDDICEQHLCLPPANAKKTKGKPARRDLIKEAEKQAAPRGCRESSRASAAGSRASSSSTGSRASARAGRDSSARAAAAIDHRDRARRDAGSRARRARSLPRRRPISSPRRPRRSSLPPLLLRRRLIRAPATSRPAVVYGIAAHRRTSRLVRGRFRDRLRARSQRRSRRAHLPKFWRRSDCARQLHADARQPHRGQSGQPHQPARRHRPRRAARSPGAHPRPLPPRRRGLVRRALPPPACPTTACHRSTPSGGAILLQYGLPIAWATSKCQGQMGRALPERRSGRQLDPLHRSTVGIAFGNLDPPAEPASGKCDCKRAAACRIQEVLLGAPAALRIPAVRAFALGRIVSVLGAQMLDVAVGWQLYDRTHSPLALGFVGLSQVIPVVLLALPAGAAADRFDRRRMAMLAQTESRAGRARAREVASGCPGRSRWRDLDDLRAPLHDRRVRPVLAPGRLVAARADRSARAVRQRQRLALERLPRDRRDRGPGAERPRHRRERGGATAVYLHRHHRRARSSSDTLSTDLAGRDPPSGKTGGRQRGSSAPASSSSSTRSCSFRRSRSISFAVLPRRLDRAVADLRQGHPPHVGARGLGLLRAAPSPAPTAAALGIQTRLPPWRQHRPGAPSPA